jgi:hypothetical protein
VQVVIRPLLRPLYKSRDGRTSEIVEIHARDPYVRLALAAALGDRATIVRDPDRYVDITSLDVLPPIKSRAPRPILIDLPMTFALALSKASGLLESRLAA